MTQDVLSKKLSNAFGQVNCPVDDEADQNGDSQQTQLPECTINHDFVIGPFVAR